MYLGIDLGTSSVKTSLISAEQQIIGSSSAALSVSRPKSGWCEQTPTDWIQATEDCIEQLRAARGSAFSVLRGIALSGQMHGATLLDSAGEVLRPCILWNDTRSHQEARQLDEHEAFRRISGNIVFSGFTAPKLVWVARHEPHIFEQVAKVLLPKDYLRYWLTGEYASEMSDASGTSWLDVGQRCWSPELLERCQLHEAQMPRLIEGNQASGQLRAELARRWGLEHSPMVYGGAGDNAATACGLGVVQEGQAFVSLGTSGVLFAASSAYRPNAASAVHAFCHALPQTWHQMGVILSATDSLNWLAQLTGASAQVLSAELPEHPAEPSDLCFAPYLSGERTPHNDARVRGAFIGLDHRHTRADLTQAVMEGVSFAIRDNLEALRTAGSEVESVIAVGGGAASPFWLQTLSHVLGVCVELPAGGDHGAAFGAARLALVGEHQENALLTPPSIACSFAPKEHLLEAYEQQYQAFTRLYPKLQNTTDRA